MNSEQILKASTKYKSFLLKMGSEPIPCSDWKILDPNQHDNVSIIMNHCCWMLGVIPIFITDRKVDKAIRWLCFIQGCLWSMGIYRIEELKDDNRIKSQS